MEVALRRTEDVFRRTQDVFRYTQEVFRHTQDVFRHTEDVFRHTEDVLRHTEDVLRRAEDVLRARKRAPLCRKKSCAYLSMAYQPRKGACLWRKEAALLRAKPSLHLQQTPSSLKASRTALILLSISRFRSLCF